MALSLGVVQGSRIRVGPHLIEVLSLGAEKGVQVAFDDAPYTLHQEEATKVHEAIRLSYRRKSRTRLVLEAPKDMRISREA